MSTETLYWVRRLLVDAFTRAIPKKPDECQVCGWPDGGSYVCPCKTVEPYRPPDRVKR